MSEKASATTDAPRSGVDRYFKITERGRRSAVRSAAAW